MASAILDRDLKDAEPLVVAGIEIRDAALLKRFYCFQKYMVHRIGGFEIFDVEWSAAAMCVVLIVFVVFGFPEIRQQVVITPARIA